MTKLKLNFIKNFPVSWFASVMGTGILANTSFFYSNYLPFLTYLASFLFYFNIGLFCVFFIPFILKIILFRKESRIELEDPIKTNFFPTFSISFVVLAANSIYILKNISVAIILWYIGTFLTIFFSILIPFVLFRSENAKIHHINPAWFIPPVGLIIIPFVGNSFISQFSGIAYEFMVFLNYFGWGAGFFIYLALLSICIYRFALIHPMPNLLAPTIWI